MRSHIESPGSSSDSTKLMRVSSILRVQLPDERGTCVRKKISKVIGPRYESRWTRRASRILRVICEWISYGTVRHDMRRDLTGGIVKPSLKPLWGVYWFGSSLHGYSVLPEVVFAISASSATLSYMV
jgi:hypothetical protein